MKGKVRLSSDMVKSFDSEGDLMAWLAKLKLVVRLQKIPDLANVIPLFLEGDALALYLQLIVEDQLDAVKAEANLKTSFMKSQESVTNLERLMGNLRRKNSLAASVSLVGVHTCFETIKSQSERGDISVATRETLWVMGHEGSLPTKKYKWKARKQEASSILGVLQRWSTRIF